MYSVMIISIESKKLHVITGHNKDKILRSQNVKYVAAILELQGIQHAAIE